MQIDDRTEYLLIIRTFPRNGFGVQHFIKGPFDSIKAARIVGQAHIRESNGFGGCGDVSIVPLAETFRAHELHCDCAYINVSS